MSIKCLDNDVPNSRCRHNVTWPCCWGISSEFLRFLQTS